MHDIFSLLCQCLMFLLLIAGKITFFAYNTDNLYAKVVNSKNLPQHCCFNLVCDKYDEIIMVGFMNSLYRGMEKCMWSILCPWNRSKYKLRKSCYVFCSLQVWRSLNIRVSQGKITWFCLFKWRELNFSF